MPDGWLYPMTHCIICGEYPISDAYFSAYNNLFYNIYNGKCLFLVHITFRKKFNYFDGN